jgi:hypothetical protein
MIFSKIKFFILYNIYLMILMEKLINYTINFLKVKAKIKIEKFVFF